VLRVLTDNAKVYRVGGCWSAVCTALGIRRRFTKPGRPWTNGKAERLNRTLLTEFAYNQPWTGNTQRLTALPAWVNAYNTERAHTALGGHPPISRLTALPAWVNAYNTERAHTALGGHPPISRLTAA